MNFLRVLLLVMASVSLLTALDALDPAAYTTANATVVKNDEALVFRVGETGSLGQARIALGRTYTKRVTIRAAIQPPPDIPYTNWTIHLGHAGTDQRAGAGYAAGSKEAWLGEWTSLHQRHAQDRRGDANAGPAITFIFTVDLEQKTITAMFGEIERTTPLTLPITAIDSLWLVSYKQGLALTSLRVIGE